MDDTLTTGPTVADYERERVAAQATRETQDRAALTGALGKPSRHEVLTAAKVLAEAFDPATPDVDYWVPLAEGVLEAARDARLGELVRDASREDPELDIQDACEHYTRQLEAAMNRVNLPRLDAAVERLDARVAAEQDSDRMARS